MSQSEAPDNITPYDSFNHYDQYIRASCAELEDEYDREAVRLLFTAGVLAVQDPSVLDHAVRRLRGAAASSDTVKVASLLRRIENASTPDVRKQGLARLDDFLVEHETKVIETAYMLGIAVGRRLGGRPLVARAAEKGGAR